VADSTLNKSDQIVAEQRDIQQMVETESQDGAASSSGATQAGARHYPEPPFPKQHQRKPGEEARLEPAPMYDAPYYRGSGKLQDKAAIVTGGDSGIGRSVAVLFAREGADVAIVYLAEHEDARVTKAAVEKEGRRCHLISGDVRDRSFCREAVAQTLREFGRLDVLVNNAAFQIHTSRFEDVTEEHLDHTVKTNLYGYFYMAQACIEHIAIWSDDPEHRISYRPLGKQRSYRLLDDEGWNSCVYAFVGQQSGRPRHTRERRCTWTGMDAP
jgi:short chain dehydrogenase